jgi:hypothetical protein
MDRTVATRDEPLRMDETHKRLLDWTYGQPPSERLAALVLDDEGYKDIDPSHPLGGPDGGRDGECTRDGEKGVWAVYFPRGQQTLKAIETKLQGDIDEARKHEPEFLVFVTNQELRQSQRNPLRALGGDIRIELLHLERVATNLDRQRMSSVREQFLRIPTATVRSAVRVKAEVIGSVRTFTGDDELLQHYVEVYEKDVRERSDKAWAAIKAEEEKKAKAEAEKAVREAAEDRRKAMEDRRQAVVEARAENQPLSLHELATQAAPKFNVHDFIKFDEIMPKFNFDHLLPKYNLGSYMTVGSNFGPPEIAAPTPDPPEPLTNKAIAELVAAYRADLEARWEPCKEYLAAVSWTGLKVRIHNAEGFLTKVQLVLTFHGARGLDHEYIESFVWEKLEDPSWQEPIDPLAYMMPMTSPRLIPRSAAPNPVEWEHDDNGDLVVKISLPELRPYEDWSSDDDDLVLMLRDDGLDSVEATYTVTAYEHHDRADGEPFAVPVERVHIFDSVNEALGAGGYLGDE